MKKQSCQSKVKHTCGTKNFASCIDYQTELPEFSELECPSIEETTEELYNLVGEIKEETDLSELGNSCLEYVETEEGKLIVKNVLLKFEEKICELEEKVNELENRPLCNQPLGDCVDTKCLTDACSGGIQTVTNTDGNISIIGSENLVVNISPSLLSTINSALQAGDNISELVNDAGYLTSFTETDPIFQASEASLFVVGDKANLDNQSGINSGDETTLSIQTKRPLKTVNGESLEGNGNVQIDYNDLDNLPIIPTPISNHSGLNLDDGTNPHGTTKSDVGLSNVDNTSDLDKPVSTATQIALDSKLDKSTTPSSVYTTDASGDQTMIPVSEFKDVLEFADSGAFPATGESGKIYVALDTNLQYRWSGSAYVKIGGSSETVLLRHITPTAPITGTTTETILYTWFIPANTFNTEDCIKLQDLTILSNTRLLSNAQVRVRFNDSNTLNTSISKLLATGVFPSGGLSGVSRYVKMTRSFDVFGGNIGAAYTIAGLNDDFQSSNYNINPFNPTIDNWLFVTIQLGNVSDSVYMKNLIITK